MLSHSRILDDPSLVNDTRVWCHWVADYDTFLRIFEINSNDSMLPIIKTLFVGQAEVFTFISTTAQRRYDWVPSNLGKQRTSRSRYPWNYSLVPLVGIFSSDMRTLATGHGICRV